MPKQAPERDLQYEVVKNLRAHLAPPAFFAGITQSGPQFRRFWNYFKSMGVRAGMPDLLVFGPNSRILGIELKIKTWRASDSQRETQGHFQMCDMGYVVCRSWDEVKHHLQAFGFELIETPPEIS